MRRLLFAAALFAASSALADQRFEATLAGHAVLPAATFVAPPAGAPPDFATSGRFTGPGNARNDRVGSQPGDTGALHGRRPTGLALPFQGQPMQGFSGIAPVRGEAGAWWVLTDNGFGNRRNSPDALLMFHKMRPDFRTGQVAVLQTIFLSDPNRVIPFHIVTDPSPTRFLTGADFDLEAIQPMADGSFWIGEEFGRFLRVLEFDTQRAAWTGRVLRYRLEDGATAIGDFNMIDDRRALVIERDNGEGDPGLACVQGTQSTADRPCFPLPARFKRVYVIDLGATDAEGFVRKVGHIDLMAIRDPQGVARQRGDRPEGAARDRFTFPFFTIEDVAMVDADHIIVANDNNLPFSAGRHLTRADDNEFILLRVPELLRAR